jgi:hypothetical protein
MYGWIWGALPFELLLKILKAMERWKLFTFVVYVLGVDIAEY